MDHVIEWLLSNRLQLFQRSRAGIHFRLCRKLRHDIFEQGNGDSPEWKTLEEVKHRHLARVRHVIEFTKFVESTKHDRDLIRFWMDVEEMRSSDTKRLPFFRAVVRKYLMKTSSHCLPDDVTNQVFKRSRDARGLDYDAIMKLQTLVFQRLHCYWLPQFLMTCTDVTDKEAEMLREIQMSERRRNGMALRSLRRCPFVRFTSKPRHDDVVHDDVIPTIKDVAESEDCDVIKKDNIP
uniref:RGS domain-containing protein n=1 Tax=Ciona intestinalis TaxID=7719 RepID=F6WDJ8_CIOIN